MTRKRPRKVRARRRMFDPAPFDFYQALDKFRVAEIRPIKSGNYRA